MPLQSERAAVNPLRVNQSVNVNVPSFAFVCAFECVEAATPILGELPAPQSCEPLPNFVEVLAGEVWNIPQREDDMLWLSDCVGPPFDLSLPVAPETVLAFWAKEKIAAIGEFLDRPATVTN
jgi:hypothetical protein